LPAANAPPSLLPYAVAKDKDAVGFLVKLGLRSEIDDLPFLIICAKSLARVQQVWKAQGDACGVTVKELVEAGCTLFEALNKFKAEDGLLAQIGRVPFVPVLYSKRAYAYGAASALATFPLCAIKDLAAPSRTKVQSLVSPVLHPDLENCHKSLENVLWPVGELDHDGHVVMTIKQLQRLSHLLGAHDNDAAAAASEDLKDSKDTSDSTLPMKPTWPGEATDIPADRCKTAKEERKKMKEKQELEELVWEAYRELDRVAEKKMELLNNIDLIKDELLKFPSIFLPKLGAFVRPDQCFTALSSSIPGLMYRLEGRLEAYPNLIKELGLSNTPSRLQVLSLRAFVVQKYKY
jgi:hypothetical protein